MIVTAQRTGKFCVAQQKQCKKHTKYSKTAFFGFQEANKWTKPRKIHFKNYTYIYFTSINTYLHITYSNLQSSSERENKRMDDKEKKKSFPTINIRTNSTYCGIYGWRKKCYLWIFFRSWSLCYFYRCFYNPSTISFSFSKNFGLHFFYI